MKKEKISRKIKNTIMFGMIAFSLHSCGNSDEKNNYLSETSGFSTAAPEISTPYQGNLGIEKMLSENEAREMIKSSLKYCYNDVKLKTLTKELNNIDEVTKTYNNE